MAKPTLVIMAAGLASRFGGDKQVTPVDDKGHLIIDYSLFDAHRAGFDKVVFIIQPFMKDNFHAAIGARIEKHMEVVYAFQTLDRYFPEDMQIPEIRKKPWGTAHAALCAMDAAPSPSSTPMTSTAAAPLKASTSSSAKRPTTTATPWWASRWKTP